MTFSSFDNAPIAAASISQVHRAVLKKEGTIIITTGVRPFIFGFPALGVIGYLIPAVLSLWLVVTILQANKY